MASVTVEITGDARKLEQTFDKINQGQKKVEDGFDNVAETGKDSARKIDEGFAKTGESGKEAARKIKEEFVNVGDTGKDSARQIEDGFEKAGESGKEAARKVNEEFVQVGTTGKDSARQIESANEAAANKGAASYNRILTELRRQGPEGRAAARAIETHLQEAGKAGRRSMSQIVDELREFDSAAAEVAEGGKSAFDDFANSAITKIGGIAAGWITVQAAVGTVNDYLKTQEALIESTLQKQQALAGTQQDSLKAFAAYTKEERDYLLTEAVPEIMNAAGVKDSSAITTALGLASGGTPKQAVDAVMAAARQNQLAPENIAPVSAAAVSVMLKTGIEDPRAALELMRTTDSQSGIGSTQNLIANLPVAMTAVATARDQDPVEAARQIGALWAAGTLGGGDVTGAATSTFTVDLTSRMFKFFSDLESQRVEARSKLESIESQIAKGEFSQANDRKERDQLAQFLEATKGSFDPSKLALNSEQAKAYKAYERERIDAKDKIDRIKERIDRGTATDKDRFELQEAEAMLADRTSFWEEQRAKAQKKLETLDHKISTSSTFEKEKVERDRLRSLIPVLESTTDPGTIFGRIEALQQSPELRQQFVGEGFGNANYTVFLQELLTAGTDTAEAIRDSFDVVQADAEGFERQIQEQRTATTQLRITTAVTGAEAAIEAASVFNDESGTLGAIRKITAEAQAAANPGGFAGFMTSLFENPYIPMVGPVGVERGTLGGTDAANEAVSAIQLLQQNRHSFAIGGIDESEAPKVAALNSAIERIEEMIGGQVASGVLSPASLQSAAARASDAAYKEGQLEREFEFRGNTAGQEAARANRELLQRLADLMEKQLEQMQQTAANTRPRPPQSDPAETIRASAASADARAPR